ncbi:MAG: site-2 protease family protein [Armatimonadota bacterium]
MKWSWKIGEVSGIEIYVHVTFLLLLGWLGVVYWMQSQELSLVVVALGYILAVFLCVGLHELGHALAARRFGIRTRDITLLPIGGVARLERMPEEPRQELWVALAGPAVNLIIAAGLFICLTFQAVLRPYDWFTLTSGPILARLLAVNVGLALFNLLPAFPMDGGRILRALLATRMDYARATHIAAAMGQGMAFLFGFLGLFVNPFLVFIALFVWIGAAQEASMVMMKHALGGIPVAKAMVTDFATLSPYDDLRRSVELILSGSQRDFPVVDNGVVVGVLTRDDLLVSLVKAGQDALVRDVMQTDFHVVDSHDMLESAFSRLQTCGCHTLPVVHGGRLVGLLTTDNVGEFLMIQAALGQRARAAGPV